MALSDEERILAQTLLIDSLVELKRAVADLSARQFSYSPAGGWPLVGILAHLYVVEAGIMRRIPNSPPSELSRVDRDRLLLALARDRHRKQEAPARVIPD